MIVQLANGKYRLLSKKKNRKGRHKNLGTFDTLEKAQKHEQEVSFFKHKRAKRK